MKIGIITIQNAINYGSTLQAYALQEVLRELGHEPYIINWQNKRLNAVYRKQYSLAQICLHICRGHIRSGFEELRERWHALLDDIYFPMRSQYDAYCRKRLCLTDAVCDIESRQFSQFDTLICGSDQIWNAEITGGDPIYALGIPTFRGRKIAYAASGNLDTWSNGLKYIQELHYISVREYSLKRMLEGYGIDKSYHVCDPTFLVSTDFWRNQLKKEPVIKPYIFAYLMWDEPIVLSYIEKLSQSKKMPAIVLHRANAYVYCEKKRLSTKTPEDFLFLLANADYVVSNSFHGTVFSIIFQKQFISYGSGERVVGVLDELELSDRLLMQNNEGFVNIDRKIDWKRVEHIVAEKRKKGISFLKKALEEEV